MRDTYDYSGDVGRLGNQSCEIQRRRLSTQQTLLKARVVLSWSCCLPPPLQRLSDKAKYVAPSFWIHECDNGLSLARIHRGRPAYRFAYCDYRSRFLVYRGSHTDPAPSLSCRLPLPCPVIVRSVVCEQSYLPIFTRALKHGLVTHQSDLNVLKQACCVCIVPTPAAED